MAMLDRMGMVPVVGIELTTYRISRIRRPIAQRKVADGASLNRR